MPDELAVPLARMGGDPEAYGLEEFYRRVAEKEGIDADEATKHVSAFMKVLGQAISDGELQDVRSQPHREFYLFSCKDRGRSMYEQPYWVEELKTSEVLNRVLNRLVGRGLSCEGSTPRGETMSNWVCGGHSGEEGVLYRASVVGRDENVRMVAASVEGGQAAGRSRHRVVSRVRGVHALRWSATGSGRAVGEGEYPLRRKTRAGQRQPGTVEGRERARPEDSLQGKLAAGCPAQSYLGQCGDEFLKVSPLW